jgi:CubicO group peptidase (beta-lactamase class C family)
MNKQLAFKTRLQEAIQEKVFPGCSLAYIDNDNNEEVVLSLGNATYDEKSFPIEPDTLYDTASLTKIMTTMTLALMLVDEGILSLDDKVGKYLPEYEISAEKQSATIRNLMTYTINYNLPGGSKSLMPGLTATQIADNALTYPLKEMPGTSYMYSNLTAFILTQVIEKVTGQSFDALVQDKIFEPLQMNTATFTPDANLVTSIPPTEVTKERGEVRGVVHDEFTYYTRRGGIANGAAGLFASILDMKKFLQMTLAGGVREEKRLISEDLVRKWTVDMFPELLPMHTPLAWGDLNNSLIDKYHREIVVKAGFTGCFMLADLKQKRAFAILSNRTYPTRPTDASSFAKLKEDLTEIALS